VNALVDPLPLVPAMCTTRSEEIFFLKEKLKQTIIIFFLVSSYITFNSTQIFTHRRNRRDAAVFKATIDPLLQISRIAHQRV
jgi:hypothetical protein